MEAEAQITEEKVVQPEATEETGLPAKKTTLATPVPDPDNPKMVSFNYEEFPITDVVNTIILEAVDRGASDLHFDPSEVGLKIRLRVDGVLHDYSLVPVYVLKNMITRIKIVSGMNITESRMPQDGAIKNSIEGMTVDLRVSCLPTNLGEKIVIRVLDYSKSSAGIEELNFSKPNLEKVNEMVKSPNGIILVTGATGSGKSTTVYAVLQKLNTEDRNIITVEDPVEMNIDGINQVQVNSDIGLDFATVLRSILRQDPDTIMIGEIRDDETARIAVRASITGHLVVSTIHTNSALATIERLVDMDVERYLLGTALTGVVSQKLAKKLCTHCREEKETNEYEQRIFKQSLNMDVPKIYGPKGCDICHNGYQGRIAIHEVLVINQEIRDAITKAVEKAQLRSLVYSSGTITMLQDGLGKVVSGDTSFEEIIKLIDLDDDLGSDSRIGLDQTLADLEDTPPTDTTAEATTPVEETPKPEATPTVETTTPEVTPTEEPKAEVVTPAPTESSSESLETLDF